MNNWNKAKKILCIRLDNFGDVMMMQPALRALKEQNIHRKLTVLTSDMGALICPFIEEIDSTIIFNAPFVKTNKKNSPSLFNETIKKIKKEKFDAAIIFTNYSQNPLPSVMIAYLSEIPLRLSFCRENPYKLLTDWVPDPEPFKEPVHAVIRQLNLVKTINAKTKDKFLSLSNYKNTVKSLEEKLKRYKITKPFIIIHPGVSDKKRQFSIIKFIDVAKRILAKKKIQIIITGNKQEEFLSKTFKKKLPERVVSLAGKLTIGELISLIDSAELILSNNTGPVHIAAAVKTPAVVLYARTNPEHTPWLVKNRVLYFDVEKKQESKNTILKFTKAKEKIKTPTSNDILKAIDDLLRD